MCTAAIALTCTFDCVLPLSHTQELVDTMNFLLAGVCSKRIVRLQTSENAWNSGKREPEVVEVRCGTGTAVGVAAS